VEKKIDTRGPHHLVSQKALKGEKGKEKKPGRTRGGVDLETGKKERNEEQDRMKMGKGRAKGGVE